jgi:sugar/nucleoside kinase (ribokinase family)
MNRIFFNGVRRLSVSSSGAGSSSAAIAAPAKGLIIGAGSNVMDVFFPVRALPHPGDKAYFGSEALVSDEIVGGVTLNHLAWARALGAPTALLALQGEDAHGRAIRAKLAALGVDGRFVRTSPQFTTSVSHIFSCARSGERTILMNPASTSRLDAAAMAAHFGGAALDAAAMVSTEISQLPLSGVEWLLDAAAARGLPSVLDVDVPPSVATGAAALGDAAGLLRCLRKATVLKLTASALDETLALLSAGEWRRE